MLATLNTEAAAAQDLDDAIYERRAQKEDFIRNHPSYDRTMWIFPQSNMIRQFCQRLVEPAGGERIFGILPSRIAQPLFQLFLLLTVIGGIVVESIATPVYRRDYYLKH
jgi:voltage-dependent calcium channel